MTLLAFRPPACLPLQRRVQMLSMLQLTVRTSESGSYRRLLTNYAGMSGLTSQPPMGAVCSALEQTNLGTGIRYEDIQTLNSYWTQVRALYSCFEANVRASDSSVFDHEMPGGQYTNLMVCLCEVASCVGSSTHHGHT